MMHETAIADKRLAAGALAYFLRVVPVQLTATLSPGFLKAFAFSEGMGDRSEKEAQALSELRATWLENLNQQRKQSEAQQVSSDLAVSQGKEAFSQALENASRQSAGQKKAFDDLLVESKRALEALEATFRAGLALKAPVNYWSNKRHHHKLRAAYAARWVAYYSAGGLVVLTIAAAHLLDIESSQALKTPLWHLAAFATVSGLYVWFARILVRLMLSHQHLESDAHERIVIANTYLALVRGGKLPETVTGTVLEALLRHSPDGIVQDDAMPLLAELLKRTK